MDDYAKLSAEAKQAWQRGYNLAHPRTRLPKPSREPTETWISKDGASTDGASKDQASKDGASEDGTSEDGTSGGREAVISSALDVVGCALEDLNDSRGKSVVAVDSGSGVQLVVMDPMSVEAVIVELDNMKTDECREALGDGFLRGMIVKAKAARAGGPDRTPTIN